MSDKSGNKKSVKEFVGSLNKNTIGILVCALVLVLTLIVYFALRGDANSEKDGSNHISQAETSEQIGDSDKSNVSTDSKKNKAWETMSDDEYDITISSLGKGYSGKFVEDGSDDSVKDVLALKFTNIGAQDIQYGEYVFDIKGETVSFKFSSLPAGQSCIVLETSKHEFKKKDHLELVSRVVAQVDELPFARDQLLVVDNSDNTITVMNLTEKEVPIARVFYKNYDEKDNEFIGGITYTAKAESVPVGGGITVAPAHYQSGKSKVVGSGVYEPES